MGLDPSSVPGAVVWGVVAGVLTSSLLLIAGLLLTKVLIPWYQALVFQGVNLSGTWVYSQEIGGIHYHYALILKQSAHWLSGNMTLSKSGAPPGSRGDYVQGFDVSGSSWEGFVTINLKSDDPQSLAFATSLLQIRGRGKQLVGQMAFRSAKEDQVASEAICWSRS